MDEPGKAMSDAAFERRARELFEASVADLDPATRTRVAAARRAAVEGLQAPRAPAWRPWLSVAAVAATVAVAAVLVVRPGPELSARPPAVAADAGRSAPVEALELIAAGEDLDLVAEDLEFYDWIELAALDALGGQG